MEKETNKKEMLWEEVPTRWALCFSKECAKRATCLHSLAAQAKPDNIKEGPAIYPTHTDQEGCARYHEARFIRQAWGFNHLLGLVRNADIKRLRAELMDVVSSKSSYYRCQNGEQSLSPEKQEAVLQFFRKNGYRENLRFDHYAERWNFD